MRVSVFASSGCWAIDASACAAARASPSAGAMEPIAIVRPAVTMEMAPMSPRLSMGPPQWPPCVRVAEAM